MSSKETNVEGKKKTSTSTNTKSKVGKKTSKTTASKTATSKTTTSAVKKKVDVKEESKVVKNVPETTGEKVKKIVSSYTFLYGVFSILIVSVAVLGGMVYTKGREYKKNRSDIVVPILEDGTKSALNIDLKQLKKDGVYALKITNYRGDKVNNESIDYSITIRNVTGADIKVTKDDSDDNLIVDKEATIIEGVGFGSDKKEESIYRFTVDKNSKIEKDALISIEIVARKRSS